jgi:serine/threonine protein kinase
MEPIVLQTCTLIPISTTKPIYVREDNPSVFVKAFPSQEAMERERDLQMRAHSIVHCPTVIDSFVENGVAYLLMEKIEGDTLYELYGGSASRLPSHIWEKIRSMISKLYYKDIHYIDITPHNFMIDNHGKLVMIDFGHAYECKVNWFLKDFLDGEKGWNVDFE